MGYRPSSHPPLTRWARHIDSVKRERGWSATRAFEEARTALGLGPKSRAGYLPFEGGREPTAEQAVALASVFGWPPEEAAPPPTGEADLRDLIAEQTKALTRQAEAMERLAAALEETADERLVSGQATALFLGVLARVLAPRGTDLDIAIQSATADLDAIRRATNQSDRGPE